VAQPQPAQDHLKDPVAGRMHQDFTRLKLGQTVGAALEWLRLHPPPGRVIYFYVVDDEGRLRGVVPTRSLLLSPPQTALAAVMVPATVTLPATATLLDACRLFLRQRLLAFPVVDEAGRLVGVVDIDHCTNELTHIDRAGVVGRLVKPLVQFMHVESSGGIVLLACTVVALVLANSPLAAAFHSLWETRAGFTFGAFVLIKPLLLWINDGLMTLFFFVVGLEIKRELISGELADPRKVLLPVVAALGGMVVPGAVYALLLAGGAGARGWGVPMATDIAFVVGFLALLGPRVPTGLKVLLLALAIVDDLGSIVVIAVAYSTGLQVVPLGLAAAGLVLMMVLVQLGVCNGVVYGVLVAGVWLGFLKSGVHPTVAGVLFGLLTPAHPLFRRRMLLDVVGDLYGRLRGHGGDDPGPTEVESPLERLETSLHPWVAFAVMPLFALANAGVHIEPPALLTPVALAVAAGLVLGKPLGIVGFSWLAVRLGMARLPDGINWRVLAGAGCLAGIGFTMSVFIASLALEGELLYEAKIGILAASAVSAVLGCGLLSAFLPPVNAGTGTPSS
jgi:NhaA family Na+:H+ antiporter